MEIREGPLTIEASQVVLVVKNPPVNEGDVRDVGSILGLGRSPGGGTSNPLQYSWLESPTDRRGWRAAARGVAKSQTRLCDRACRPHRVFSLSRTERVISFSVVTFPLPQHYESVKSDLAHGIILSVCCIF